MKEESVLLSIEDNIATITLNRPEKLNALNHNVWYGIKEAIDKIQENKEVRVAILCGKGKMFSSGLDLSSDNPFINLFQYSSPAKASKEFYRLIKEVQKIYTQLEELSVPVICVIQRGAIGGALELTLCCDIRLADENAFFSIPEVKLGLSPDLGGCTRLPKIVGVGKAKELIYTGKRISAQEAKEIGLVNEIYKLDDLFECAKNLAKEIRDNAPLAVQSAKLAINRGLELDKETALDYEAFLNTHCLISSDVKEGFISYFEKRKSEFKGM